MPSIVKGAFVLVFALAGVACGGDDSTGGGAGGTGQSAGSMTPGAGGSGGTSSAGGSSSAGSMMPGGAAGTSGGAGGMTPGTDGGTMCSVMNQNACDTCVFAKCCPAYDACNKDDDCMLGMGNLAECVANDAAMVGQCYDDFATTNDMASSLRMCVKMSCDAACTTVTP